MKFKAVSKFAAAAFMAMARTVAKDVHRIQCIMARRSSRSREFSLSLTIEIYIRTTCRGRTSIDTRPFGKLTKQHRIALS